MTGQTARKLRKCVVKAPRSMVAEPLESRRLLAVSLSLSGGVLSIHEGSSGVANSTTIQLTNGGSAIQIDESPHTLSATTPLLNDGWTVGAGSDTASGPETGISSIVINTADAADQLIVLSMNLPVQVQTGLGAQNSIQIGQYGVPAGAQQITQPITYDGSQAQSAILMLADGTDPGNIDPTISSTSVLGFAPAAIDFTAPEPQVSGAPNLFLECFTGTGTSDFILAQDPTNSAAIDNIIQSSGAGAVSVQKLNANSTANISANTGASEIVRLGSTGSISNIRGAVTANFLQGTGSVIVNDSADTVAHAFALTGNLSLSEDGTKILDCQGSPTAFTLETGTAQNTANINVPQASSPLALNVELGGTSESVSVKGIQSSVQVKIDGGAGVDNVSIDGSSVVGSVRIANTIGLEAVTVDASQSSSARVISVSDAQVSGLPAQLLLLANLKTLSVIGGAGFDNFSVTPSVTVPISVDGGPFSGAPTDRLDVNVSQVTAKELSLQSDASGEHGAYTFTNRQPVNFSHFDQVTPAFGDFSGTVFNGQDLAPVGGATVVVDSNSNGAADAGEPTATTAADGTFAFTGLPAGTFPLLVLGTALSLLTPVSVTLAAGVLPPPVNVALAPAATAGGPDLVATVNVSTGKSATSKPKVTVKITNIGAAMVAAAGAQVLLFASADKVLDPLDSKLLSSAANLKLKAKGSKTLTLTGAAATSLVTGRYYILASVDSGNSIPEASETNNVAAGTKQLLLAPPLADLTGKFGPTPKTASKSKTLTIPLTLLNAGTIAAGGAIEVDFFASTDKTLDDADAEIAFNSTLRAHVAAGKSQPAKVKISLAALPAGSYFIVARINPTHTVNEASFTNNVIFSTIAIVIS